MSANLDAYFNAVSKLVKQAGEIINTKIGQKKNVSVKSCEIDLVTETDTEVEKLLINGLKQEFPDHLFIGEESVADGASCDLTDSPTWIIDPVDGTMNFVHGFPHSCVSIALSIKKEPQIGIIYNPMMNQLFTAQKGKGAFLNGQRIHVSDIDELGKALIMLEPGTSRDPGKMKCVMQTLEKVTAAAHGTRCLGSAALDIAMVAMGGADAYMEAGPHIWDFAAGEILVKEAGGVVLDPSGGPLDRLSRRFLCASNQKLAEQLIPKIEQYYPQPRD